jgi:hypothetical protein
MAVEISTIFDGAGVNVTTIVGALPVVIGGIAKAPGWFSDFNEKAHKAKSAKMTWLHDALKESKHIHSPGLFREIVAQLAYGYAYSSDEVEFATARRNPTGILRDIRYGKAFAVMSQDRKGFRPKKEPLLLRWVSLSRRQAITDWLLVVFIIGLISCLILSWFAPIGGLMLSVEFAFGVWSMATASRATSCAVRLCALTEDHLCAPFESPPPCDVTATVESLAETAFNGHASQLKVVDERKSPGLAVIGAESTAASIPSGH